MLNLIQMRNTEPEEQLAVMKAQYDAASYGARLLLDRFPSLLHRL